MAVIHQRASNYFFKRLVRNSHLCQACWQLQAPVHVPQRIGNITAAGQAHGSGHAVQSFFFLHRLGWGVELHHSWQKHGVQRAVMQPRVNPAQAVAQRMHTTQAFLKGHGPLH